MFVRSGICLVAALALTLCSGCVEKFVHNRVQNYADRNLVIVEPKKTDAAAPEASKNTEPLVVGKPIVRLIGYKTDVAKRYLFLAPNFPLPPAKRWRNWLLEHQDAVHCTLEWRDEKGQWFFAEMRSPHFEPRRAVYRVGGGEFPGTAYDAYGIYIVPSRAPRDIDDRGEKVTIVFEEDTPCDYRAVDAEVRKYGAKYAQPGDPGTGGGGKHNVGLGGPAYKPAQNSNTMVNYILRRCGYKRAAPDRAVGWDREPHFPYSTNAETVKLDSAP